MACSYILSGLRVFDIRDPENPREIAYYNAPVDPRIVPEGGIAPGPSNWAMSSPSFVPQRGEIWYSDGLSGFYAVRTTNGVWPFGGNSGAAASAWRAARRSGRATSAASGSATAGASSTACPCRRSRRRVASTATA